jgi:hypothetical protein
LRRVGLHSRNGFRTECRLLHSKPPPTPPF